MKHKNIKLISLALSFVSCVSLSSCSEKTSNDNDMQPSFSMDWESAISNDHVPGDLLVTLSESISRSIISGSTTEQAFFKQTGLKIQSFECLTPFQLTNPDVLSGVQETNLIYLISFEDKTDDALLKNAKAIATINGVVEVGFNYIVAPSAVPNDAMFYQQWGLKSSSAFDINVQPVWNYQTTGSNNTRIGIIDTGIEAHSDLNINSSLSKNITDEALALSCHGTHVAGIAAAIGNNGIGITGVSQHASLVSYKISRKTQIIDNNDPYEYHYEDRGNTARVIACINDATSLWNTSNRISVLNYSFSGYAYDNILLRSIKSFPGTFVWSAGNDGNPLSNNDYRFTPNLICVGSYDENGTISSFSNWGDAVNIYAPGNNILSTVRGGGYESWAGTSMAAPHVSGAAALLYTKFPGITARQVKDAIVNSVNYERVIHNGYGVLEPIKRLDVNAALNYAQDLYSSSTNDALHLEALKTDGTEWKVLACNTTLSTMDVAYMPTTVSESTAMNMPLTSSVCKTSIPAKSSKILTITKSGSNECVVASVYNNQEQKRKITYLYRDYYDVWAQVNLPLFKEASSFISNSSSRINETFFKDSSIKGVSFSIVGSRTNWFVKDWKIKIKNEMSKSVYVRYNEKMCFYNDGKNWSNLSHDGNTIKLNPKTESSEIWVNANGTADSIAMCLEYVNEYGANMRYTTVANGISNSGHSTAGHAFVMC